MAVFGSLKDIDLLELLPLLSGQKGKLILTPQKGTEFTLYIDGDKVVCVQKGRNGLPPLRVQEQLFGIINGEGDANFEFVPGGTPKRCYGQLELRLDELVLKLSTLRDEVKNLKNSLPHPRAIFALANPAPAFKDTQLAAFVNESWSLLEKGTSAEEIAAKQGIPLDHVRYMLYRLRALGVIKPLPKATQPEKRKGLASRLLGLIKRRFGLAS